MHAKSMSFRPLKKARQTVLQRLYSYVVWLQVFKSMWSLIRWFNLRIELMVAVLGNKDHNLVNNMSFLVGRMKRWYTNLRGV